MTILEVKRKKNEAELQINKILQTLCDEINCDINFSFNSYSLVITSDAIHNKQIFNCAIEVKI